MKKFQFRLQKILEYKEMIENKKKQELARHISDYNKTELDMEDAKKTRVKIIQKIKNNFTDPVYVQLSRNALIGVEQTLENNKKKQIEIQERIDAAREEYIKARQEKKAFEKLKEKYLLEHKYLEKKELEKLMEESSIRLWNEGNIHEYETT